MGDIHQPLHAADNHDGGGNDVEVSNRSCGQYGCELHAYWDTTLVRQIMRGRRPGELLSALHASAATQPLLWNLDPYAWAEESHDVARSVAYNLPTFSCGHTQATTIDESYDQSAIKAIRMQLAKAGKRLALVLNAAFDQTN